MPRRTLLLLTALVLALHWLALAGLPAGGGAPRGAPERLAFHTRMLAAPPAPQAAPEPAPAPPAARPAPRPRPAARPAPAPAPRPAPPPPQPEPEPAWPEPAGAGIEPLPAELLAQAGADAAPAPEGAAADAADTPPAAVAGPVPPQAAADPPAPAADGGAAAASAAPGASAASAPSPAAAPAAAPAGESAGVEIRPPGAAGAAASTTPPPVRVPPPAQLVFDVSGQAKKFQYHASAELSWRQDGTRYEARQQIKAFLLGTRSQSSVGRLTAQGLQPERFADKARSERAAHLDFERHEVTFSANAPRAAIGDGTQDRLSVFIQLGSLLAAAPERYPPGTQITLTTVGVKSADRWTFTVEGAETLQLPAGELPALKLQRVPREGKDYDQKAELWLGTRLGYLPVRIRITQANGDYADLMLQSHDAPSPP